MSVLSRVTVAALMCLGLVVCAKDDGDGPQEPRRCSRSSDTVAAARRVVRANQRCLHRRSDVAGRISVVDGTVVAVPAIGSPGGLADVTFPEAGTCSLRQLIRVKSAMLVNRPSEGKLFWQFRGRTVCTTRGHIATICGTRDVFVSVLQRSQNAQWGCWSDPDPQLVVAVREGVLVVTPPGGESSVIVRAGEAFDALTGLLGSAMFTPLDLRLFAQQGGTARVDVNTVGPGSVVASEISCGEDCSQVYTLGSAVTFSARPDTGGRFVSWSGDCQGSGTTCQIVIDGPKTIGATFELATPSGVVGNLLTVTTSGPGSVGSTPGGITCGSDCDERYEEGSVTLSAVPSASVLFIGWTGDCSGIEPTCQLSMSAPRTVGVVFAACTITPDQASVIGTSGDDVICAGSFTTGLTIDGLGGGDVIESGSGNDTLTGGDGDDLILGGAGDDSIDGGAGVDTVYGGGGSDYCDSEESGSGCEFNTPD